MLTLVSKDSVKISDHFDVLCVLIACMVLEIINQMSKNQKSSLIVWNTVCSSGRCGSLTLYAFNTKLGDSLLQVVVVYSMCLTLSLIRE